MHAVQYFLSESRIDVFERQDYILYAYIVLYSYCNSWGVNAGSSSTVQLRDNILSVTDTAVELKMVTLEFIDLINHTLILTLSTRQYFSLSVTSAWLDIAISRGGHTSIDSITVTDMIHFYRSNKIFIILMVTNHLLAV